MSIALKNNTAQGLAAAASYQSAATLTTIPARAKVPGQFTARHLGSGGYWYFSFGGATLSATDYAIKLGPGEPWTEVDPPIGIIKALASADANGSSSWSAGWRTE